MKNKKEANVSIEVESILGSVKAGTELLRWESLNVLKEQKRSLWLRYRE